MAFSTSVFFADSFAHYSQAQLNSKWTSTSFATLGATVGREGRPGVSVGTSGATGDLTYLAPSASVGIVTGFAYYIQNQDSYGSQIYHGDEVTLGNEVRLFLNSDGTLALQVGTGPNYLIGISKSTLSIQTWAYIELQYFMISTGGGSPTIQITAGLHINGVLEIAATTKITQIPATGTIGTERHVYQGSNSPFSGANFCDIYIASVSSFDELNYLGDLKVLFTLLNGDSAGNQWTGTTFTAPNTYKNLNSNPSTDANEIFDTTVGHQSYFTVTAISSFTGSIKAVHSVIRCKAATGTEQISPMLGTIASHAQGPNLSPSTLGFSFKSAGWMTNLDPAINAAWTVSNFNAETFGVLEVHT